MPQLTYFHIKKDGSRLPARSSAGLILNVMNDKKRSGEIAVEVMSGSRYDGNRADRSAELINITFPDGCIWSGTFDDLHTALMHKK